MTKGTISDFGSVGCERFDAQQDSALLRNAMKGLGTDEDLVINVVSHRSNKQRQELKRMYHQMWERDLVKDLKSELSGHFEDIIIALFRLPVEFDAWSLREAMAGVGTTESTLTEILSSRNNAEIKAIIEVYKRLYEKDLSVEIRSETSGDYRRLLLSLLEATRCEREPLSSEKAGEDAKKLYHSAEAIKGINDFSFNVIFSSRSFEQLVLVFQAYEKISMKTMEQAIKSELAGDLKESILAIRQCAIDKPSYFAERLYTSMKGAGTNDKALIRLMVSRSEIDMVEIKRAFLTKYIKSLEDFIKKDTCGKYRKVLIELCRGNNGHSS